MMPKALFLACGLLVALAGCGEPPTGVPPAELFESLDEAVAVDGALAVRRDYELVELPLLPGHTRGEARALNERGDVVGETCTPSGVGSSCRAVLWRRGEVIDLIPGKFGRARGINHRGDVVGFYDPTEGGFERVGFVWIRGVVTVLPPLVPYLEARASDINDRGLVVGESGGSPQPVWWQRGETDELGLYPGGIVAVANSVNNKGWVAGQGDTGATFLPVVWRDGVIVGLPLAGGSGGVAHDISESGLIGGGVDGRPVVWLKDQMIELDVPPGATGGSVSGLNEPGVAVGRVSGPAYGIRPAYWERGVLMTLPTGIYNEGVTNDINNRGTIVGYVGRRGESVPALWKRKGKGA